MLIFPYQCPNYIPKLVLLLMGVHHLNLLCDFERC